jgi:hypothetical protein
VRILEQGITDPKELVTLTTADFEIADIEEAPVRILSELESLVGLSSVKSFVTELMAQIQIEQKRKSLVRLCAILHSHLYRDEPCHTIASCVRGKYP